MRIRTWVDLDPYGIALKLVRNPDGGLFYCLVPAAHGSAADVARHAEGLSAMGFRRQGSGAFFHPAEFVRERPVNQPEAQDFRAGFPLVREVPFDRDRHVHAVARPAAERAAVADGNLAAIARAAAAFPAHGDARRTLDEIAAAATAFARDHGLDASAAFDDAVAREGYPGGTPPEPEAAGLRP